LADIVDVQFAHKESLDETGRLVSSSQLNRTSLISIPQYVSRYETAMGDMYRVCIPNDYVSQAYPMYHRRIHVSQFNLVSYDTCNIHVSLAETALGCTARQKAQYFFMGRY